MRIFTRYILKEVLWHGLIGASVFTFVIFMRELTRILEAVVRNSAPFPSVAEIFFLTLPAALKVTIPMGVLVGILLGLSRMAADSEVTAMRASGVSVRKFLKIISVFGVAAWILALLNTVIIEPRSAAALAKLQHKLAATQISFEIQPHVFYEGFKNHVLYVEDVTSASGVAVWKNVFHIKHMVLKAFIEDMRLDFKRNLRGSQLVLQSGQGSRGAGLDDYRIDERQKPRGDAKHRDNFEEFAYAHAGSAHGRDFTIGGHAAQPQQDSHKHPHGDGDFQRGRQGKKENFRYAGERSAVAHHGFKDPREFAHENNESED